MPKLTTGDYEGANRALRQWLRRRKAQFEVPVLDEQGRVTGETYDTRLGRAGQPDPERFKAPKPEIR